MTQKAYTTPNYLAEVTARTIAQSFRADWHLNDDPLAVGFGDYTLIREGEIKAFLCVIEGEEDGGDIFLDLAQANRCSTTYRALGVKLLVARRVEAGIAVAVLDGEKVTGLQVHPTARNRYGWIVEASEFRRVIPLPDGKTWADYRTAMEG